MEQQQVEAEPSFTALTEREHDAFKRQMSSEAFERFLNRCRLVEELALDVLPAGDRRFLRIAEDAVRSLAQIDRILREAQQQKKIPKGWSEGLQYDLAFQLLKRDAMEYLYETLEITEKERALILEGLGPLFYFSGATEYYEGYQRALSTMQKSVIEQLGSDRAVTIENALARYAMELRRIQHETPYTTAELKRRSIQHDDPFLNTLLPWIDYKRRGSPLGVMDVEEAMDAVIMNRVEPRFRLVMNR